MSTPLKQIKPWWITAVAGMASFLDGAAIVGTGTALVLYQDELGLTGESIGQLSALLTFMIAIGSVIGGRLGDRLGRRRVFTVTILLYALGTLILVAALAPAMLYVGVILVGLASGADLPVSLAMIAETVPRNKRGRMVTSTHMLWIAGILAVTIIGIFVGGMGATGARVLYGILLVVAIVVLLLRRRLPESAEWSTAREAELREAVPASQGSSLKTLLQKRHFVPLIAVGLFFAISNVAANTGGQFSTYLFVNVAGSDVQTASAVTFVQTLIGLPTLWVVARLMDTRWRMLGFAIGAIIAVVALLAPAIFGVTVPSLTFMLWALIIGNSFGGEAMFKVWSQELFPTLNRATAQGIMIGFTRGLAALVALVTPALAATGSLLFIVVTAGYVVASLIGLLWVPRLPLAEEPIVSPEASKAA